MALSGDSLDANRHVFLCGQVYADFAVGMIGGAPDGHIPGVNDIDIVDCGCFQL